MTDAEIIQDLRSHLNQLVTQDRFSGAALVAKNGDILFKQAYGLADHAFNAPNKVDTKFNLASTAKLFTATSILQLAGEGKLSLDDPLIEVLPDYPNKEIASKVTIRQVLMHRSGVGDFLGREFMETNPTKLQTLRDYLPLFANKPLLFEPGTQYSYSNSGMLVMGLIVEQLSGQRFEDYVQEHVFKPAGMANTGYYTSEDDIPNLALGYTSMGVKPGTPRKVALHLVRGAFAVGSSGAYSTVEDLLRFAQAIKGGKLLNREYTDLLLRYSPADTKQQYHVYGWEHRYVNGVHIAGHWGAGPGTSTNLWIYPDLGYAVAVLSNHEGTAELVAKRLETRLTRQESPQAVRLSAETLKRYEGRYVSTKPPGPGMFVMAGTPGSAQPATAPAGRGPTTGSPGGSMMRPSIEVTADQEGLVVSFPQMGKHKFLPLSPAEFFDADTLGGRLTFTKDDKGEIVGLTATGILSETTTATKLLLLLR